MGEQEVKRVLEHMKRNTKTLPENQDGSMCFRPGPVLWTHAEKSP